MRAFLRVMAVVLIAVTFGACKSSNASSAGPSDAAHTSSSVVTAGGGAAVDAGAPGHCATDADCALTRRNAGECCEKLCSPRAALKSEVAAETSRCGDELHCPQMSCAPPRFTPTAACEAGQCVVRTSRTAD